MRLVAALAYIASGMWLLFGLVAEPPLLVGMATFFALLFSSTFLFNKRLIARIRRMSVEDYVADLEKKGRLVRVQIESRQAICYEDLNTGCMAYFVDAAGKGVLCLYGQYLYSYEPITDDPESIQKRGFPRTKFVVLRDARDSEFLHLVLEGEVFEPEFIKQPASEKLLQLGITLEDGLFSPELQFQRIKQALS